MKKVVKVKPNSRRQEIIEAEDNSLVVYLKSPPTDGKANRELIKLLAEHFDIAPSRVTIEKGLTSPSKLVKIEI